MICSDYRQQALLFINEGPSYSASSIIRPGTLMRDLVAPIERLSNSFHPPVPDVKAAADLISYLCIDHLSTSARKFCAERG
jgi:hypothetical protein